MRYSWITFITMTILLVPLSLFGQDGPSLRKKSITISSPKTKIDTLSLLPNTFKIDGVDKFKYFLEPVSATLYVFDSLMLGDVYLIEYQVFDDDYSKIFSHKSLSLVEARRPHHVTADVQVISFKMLMEDEKLYTNGSVSRGVSVGNNQDLVLNSSLNLQISGKLSDDVEIVASITDKNIPIKPEGNTQFVQDINSIFITLKIRDMAEIRAGDIAKRQISDDFLRYNRNSLGLHGIVQSVDNQRFRITNSLGGGISKGKFARQDLSVQNGVQGPYRLYGSNNEISISIVTGSERVYLDGKLLTRGQDNDYVIDYNTSEITFTPKILVTSEKRFAVEFEYSDRHYVRYNLFSDNEIEIKCKFPTTLFVNFFHEQDLKNQSVQPELNDAHKLFLSQTGDHFSGFFNAFEPAAYTPNQIQYCKIDTLYNNTIYTIYNFSNNENETLYSPSFSFVGANKGDYTLSQNTTNGRVFEWIAPLDGVPQGDYEPYLALTAPTLHQMLTLGFESELRKQSKLSGEIAISNHDKNLFSKKNDNDNIGLSYNLKFSDKEPIFSKTDSVPWILSAEIALQHVNRLFSPFESFRSVEFARDFNLASDYSTTHSEWFAVGKFDASKSLTHRLLYELHFFLRQGDSRALRNVFSSDDSWKTWRLKSRTSFLLAADSLQRSRYITSSINLSKTFKSIVLGVDNLLEHNKFRDSFSGKLRQNSFSFNDATVFIRSNSLTYSGFEFAYKNRIDFTPTEYFLRLQTLTDETKLRYKLQNVKNHNFSANIIYRHQLLYDSLKNTSSEHYFVGNVSYTGRFLKNVIVLNTYYEAGSGMEQKKSFTFIKVAQGQGTHVWNDYNGNGIEEVGEFEVAAFQDQSEYIKVWIAGNQYVNVYNNSLSQSLLIRPAAVWASQKGFRKFLSRFSNATNFRANLKHTSKMFVPFAGNDDDGTVSNQMNFSNNLSFNNNSSKFAFEYVAQKNLNKQFLYYGFEDNRVDIQEVTLKSSPVTPLFIQTALGYRISSNSSTLYSRDYKIECYNLKNEIRLQLQNRHIASLSLDYSMQRNTLGREKINKLSFEAVYSFRILNRGTLDFLMQYIDIVGDSGNNSSVSYNMLGGLSLGKNFVWNADFKIFLTDLLQLTLIYSGRAVPHHKVVHTGNVSINALF